MSADQLEVRAANLLRAGLAREGAVAHLTVWGGSMAPALRDGERVEVARVDSAATVRPGDVVVAYSPTGALVCHRVLAHGRSGGLWLAGDATTEVEPITAHALIGVVRGPRSLRTALRARARWVTLKARHSLRNVLQGVRGSLRARAHAPGHRSSA